jgi:deferrochelatase/peroxidase EfeB
VFRWIYQDVAAFNRFLRAEGPRLFPHLKRDDAEELLAAKLMGRWRDGTPLVLSPDSPDPALAERDFGFHETDPDGERCPFSAHIRVMNPRDQPIKRALGRVPAVLRRGMPYGPPLDGPEDDGVDRGLIGVFLCADVSRQVLTLTSWATQNDFSPVYRASPRVQDALIGNRVTSDRSFTVPGAAAAIEEMPAFLRTKGTAIVLYPSGTTLRAIIGRRAGG